MLIPLAGEAGLRSGEIGALRWTDIDFAKREVNVRRNLVRGHEGTPKGRKTGGDSELVAERFGAALRGRFRGVFATVVFAALDTSAERRFIGAFERRFG